MSPCLPAVAFRPDHTPRLAASVSGDTAAALDGDRVALFALPTLAPLGEVGLPRDATERDFGFVGDRLLIATRRSDRTLVQVVDPASLRLVTETELRSAAMLAAISSTHAVFRDSTGATAVTLDGDRLNIAPLPLRQPLTCAGALDDGRVLLNVAGALEIWDLATRRPLVRLKTQRSIVARHLGGTSRWVWVVPVERPRHVEVLPIDGRTAPWSYLFDRPIAATAASPSSDVIVLIAPSHPPALLALGNRDATPVAFSDRPAEAACLAWRNEPVAITGTRDEPLAAWSIRGTGVARTAVQVGGLLDGDAAETVPDLSDDAGDPEAASARGPAGSPASSGVPSVGDRLREWRDRMRARPAVAPQVAASPGPVGAWRTALVAWTRTQLTLASPEPPPWNEASPLARVAERLELPHGAACGLALLYGAYLLGERVVRASLARAVGDDSAWEEALGRGALARTAAAHFGKRHVRLTPEVADALDERPPRHVRIVPSSEPSIRTLAGACAILVDPAHPADAAPLVADALGTTIALLDLRDDFGALVPGLLEARLAGAVAFVLPPVTTPPPWIDAVTPALIAVVPGQERAVGLPVLLDVSQPVT